MSTEIRQEVNAAGGPVNGKCPGVLTPTGWMPFCCIGIFFIIVGIAAMLLPIATALAVDVVTGVVLLVAGIGYALHTSTARRWEGALWSGLWSVLYIVSGIMLLANPMSGVVTLTLLVAILFVIEGVSKLLLAARLSPDFNRPWLVADGIAGAALGVLIWSQWPNDSGWVLGLLVGLRLLLAGSLLITFAVALRRIGHSTGVDESELIQNRNRVS